MTEFEEKVIGILEKFAEEYKEFEPVTNKEADPYLRSTPYIYPNATDENGQFQVMGYKIYKKKVK